MTRTCAQCSAFQRLPSPVGLLRDRNLCRLHLFHPRAESSVCSSIVNGWRVKWKASGLQWTIFEDMCSTIWQLKRHGVPIGEIWCSGMPSYSAADRERGCVWCAFAEQPINDPIEELKHGTLTECCRALIARVKGETDG